jgi:hypothetical protein
MSKCVHCVYRPYRYRLAPIRAAFALCDRDVHFRVRCRHRIWRNRAATDYLSGGDIRMIDLVGASCHRATIQIPMAKRPSMTTAKHPAVSSIEAYPTRAH